MLEKYIDSRFVYRQKVGLQSRTLESMRADKHRPFFLEVLGKPEGIARNMMGRGNHSTFLKAFNRQSIPDDVATLALSLAVMQCWMDLHHVKVE